MTGPRADPGAGQDTEAPAIRVRLDELLARRGMTLTELSGRVDVTVVNLSILKNGRARAIRFSTLARLCEALDCQPGDLLACHPSAGRSAAAGERLGQRPAPAARRDALRGTAGPLSCLTIIRGGRRPDGR